MSYHDNIATFLNKYIYNIHMYILPLPLEPMFFLGDPWGFQRSKRKAFASSATKISRFPSSWMLTKHQLYGYGPWCKGKPETPRPPPQTKNSQKIRWRVFWYPPFLGTWNFWWWCIFVQEENSPLSMNPWVPWRPTGSESWGIVVQHSLPEHSTWQGFIRFIPVVSCDISWNPASRLQKDNEGFPRGNPVEPHKYHAMWSGRELCSWMFVAQLIESMTSRVPEMKCNNNVLYHLYYHSAHNKDLNTMFCRFFPYIVLESIQRKATNHLFPVGCWSSTSYA